MVAQIDFHVHFVGNGASGSGCTLTKRGITKIVAPFMLRTMGLSGRDLKRDLDSIYLSRLKQLLDESSLSHVVLLAMDYPHTESGEPLYQKSSFYVPNDHILTIAQEDPRFIPAISIHPARPDALDEVDRLASLGARVFKILPNCHNLNPSDAQYRTFWERLAKYKIVALFHTGGELALPVLNVQFEDPSLLRGPLECGLTVIAAHGGTKCTPWGKDYTDVLAEMLEEYPHLYTDSSALLSPNRAWAIPYFLREPFRSRTVHGSDLPVPTAPIWPFLFRSLSFEKMRSLSKLSPLERDLQTKLALGFDTNCARRGAMLLGL